MVNMTDIFGNALSIAGSFMDSDLVNRFMMVIFAVILVFGVLNCILGYRLLCRLRIDSDAAVVRFKFGSQAAYDEAYMDLIDSNHIQDIAKYYMEVHGLSQISYHYGVIDNMKTLYFMF